MISGVNTRIACKRTRFGVFALLPNPAIAGICGYNNFDCVIRSAEHGAASETSA